MKKILIFANIILIILCFSVNKVEAASEDYNSYSEIMMASGKLLSNFTEEEYKSYYKEIEKRRFWGWNTYVVNSNVPCTYIARTVYETSNESKDPVSYEITITTETETKTSISATGSIKYELKGEVKKFKHDLDSKISLDFKYQNMESKKRTEKLKIPVEGKTRLLVTITGTGVITNGVAAYYTFWCLNQKGGFEYFTITNEFQKIEKVLYD